MASFKLNIANAQGCPPADELAALMTEYGLPEGDEFGVLSATSSSDNAYGTVIRRTKQAVQKLDDETGEVTTTAVEKVQLLPIGVRPSTDRLEIYAGSKSGIEQIGAFLGSCLALPVVVEPIEIDVLSAINWLSQNTKRFQLKSVRINEYAHNSYMMGPYTPKFLDTAHGQEFLEEYGEFATAANVRFQGPTGRVSATLRPVACLNFSCNEDDQHEVQSILRKLV
jgi:hypothetical protein